MPLNVKIRVRKKDELSMRRGVISIPKFDNLEDPPQRIRLVNSDQTIMSFDVFMEAEIDKKSLRKSRRHIFDIIKPGLCLGVSEDDDYPYIPTSSYSANITEGNTISRSDGVLKHHFTLSKNTNNDYDDQLLSKRNKGILGKCKPGGCLDPPFSEDKYIYKPAQRQLKSDQSISNRKDLIGADEKSNGKRSSIFDSNFFRKKRKSTDKSTSTKGQTMKISHSNSILDLYQMDSTANSFSTSNSNSIITYPPTLIPPDLPINDGKVVKSRVLSEEKSRKSFNEYTDSFFIPPKNTNKVKDQNKSGEANATDVNNATIVESFDGNGTKTKQTNNKRMPIPLQIPVLHISDFLRQTAIDSINTHSSSQYLTDQDNDRTPSPGNVNICEEVKDNQTLTKLKDQITESLTVMRSKYEISDENNIPLCGETNEESVQIESSVISVEPKHPKMTEIKDGRENETFINEDELSFQTNLRNISRDESPKKGPSEIRISQDLSKTLPLLGSSFIDRRESNEPISLNQFKPNPNGNELSSKNGFEDEFKDIYFNEESSLLPFSIPTKTTENVKPQNQHSNDEGKMESESYHENDIDIDSLQSSFCSNESKKLIRGKYFPSTHELNSDINLQDNLKYVKHEKQSSQIFITSKSLKSEGSIESTHIKQIPMEDKLRSKNKLLNDLEVESQNDSSDINNSFRSRVKENDELSSRDIPQKDLETLSKQDTNFEFVQKVDKEGTKNASLDVINKSLDQQVIQSQYYENETRISKLNMLEKPLHVAKEDLFENQSTDNITYSNRFGTNLSQHGTPQEKSILTSQIAEYALESQHKNSSLIEDSLSQYLNKRDDYGQSLELSISENIIQDQLKDGILNNDDEYGNFKPSVNGEKLSYQSRTNNIENTPNDVKENTFLKPKVISDYDEKLTENEFTILKEIQDHFHGQDTNKKILTENNLNRETESPYIENANIDFEHSLQDIDGKTSNDIIQSNRDLDKIRIPTDNIESLKSENRSYVTNPLIIGTSTEKYEQVNGGKESGYNNNEKEYEWKTVLRSGPGEFDESYDSYTRSLSKDFHSNASTSTVKSTKDKGIMSPEKRALISSSTDTPTIIIPFSLKPADVFTLSHKEVGKQSHFTKSFYGSTSVSSSIPSNSILKSDLKKDSVIVDLGFQSYLNDKNERVVKTFDTTIEPKRYQNDSMTVVKSQIRLSTNEMKVPVDTENDMLIQMKRASIHRVHISDIEFETVLDKGKTKPKGKTMQLNGSEINGSESKYYQKITDANILHDTLVEIYDQELVPLQIIIKSLKEEIDVLASQQMLFKEKIYSTKKSKPPRIVHSNKKCGCLKRY